MFVYGKCECFVMQMLYVCVLCASYGSSQCCILHDLQFGNAGCCCCSPSETYGRKWGDSNFQILTELPVPPQAAVVVGTF